MRAAVFLIGAALLAPALGHAQTEPVVAPADDATRDADFADYKQRLFQLIATYKREETSAADIEAIMGQRFTIVDQKGGNQGWIVKESMGFKSLKFHHRVPVYYGEPMRDKPINGGTYWEVQYYVNFDFVSARPAMAMFSDESRCLTVAEFEAGLTAAGQTYKVETFVQNPTVETEDGEPEPPNDFHIIVKRGDLMTSGGLDLSAYISRETRHYQADDPRAIDPTQGCIQSVSIV